MNESLITWNVANWITVIIMATLGFLVLGAIGGAITKGAGEAQPATV